MQQNTEMEKNMETEVAEVNGITYLVKIHYEKRRNCMVSIRKRAINIRIPSFLNREEKARQLKRMKAWAMKKLMENPEKFKPKPQKDYNDGDLLKIGDEEYTLKIESKNKKSSSARLAGDTIQLFLSENLSKEEQNNHISTLISRCVDKIFFKHNKSNWGSCSKAGNINISTRLLFAPDDVLEYVCIHELAHLLERNHSKKFWTLVEKAMPDYKEKEQWLKENGDICRF